MHPTGLIFCDSYRNEKFEWMSSAVAYAVRSLHGTPGYDNTGAPEILRLDFWSEPGPEQDLDLRTCPGHPVLAGSCHERSENRSGTNPRSGQRKLRPETLPACRDVQEIKS